MFFDWFTPLLDLTLTSRNDRFAVYSYDAAVTRLKAHGIKTHRPRCYNGEHWEFVVDAGRGDEAYDILSRAGLL